MAKPKKTIIGRLARLLFVMLAICFVVSVGMISKNLYDGHVSAAAFDDLRQVQAAATGDAAGVADLYNDLHAKNADYAGWIKIDGTGVDYPVMYTPSAPEYYLRRAFDQSNSMNGTPFIGEGSTDTSESFIIYGHDMDDGSMFGTLDRYAEQSFQQSHPRIVYYDANDMREYEVFAAVQTRILGQGEPGFRYYNSVGDLTPEQFAELTTWLRQNSLYDTGIIPQSGEQILMLSTCSYHTENGRFVVAARRVK
ncbi:MAG: class B sortase [Peptococcaceae bacterium]|nr:class B sortase [Peptococcaceae bacterium]